MSDRKAEYELYYWPSIQGRGEFVRLALEAAGAPYRDVAREPVESGGGVPALMKFLKGHEPGTAPFAPPFLRHEGVVVAQTALVLHYLGGRIGLAPADEAGRYAVQQHTLTIADLVAEAHETHHPIASSLYYDDQKPEAKKRAHHFVHERVPKYLAYFEHAIERAKDDFLAGGAMSYADLGCFQIVEGLRYAFPKAMKKHEHAAPRVVALRDRVAAHPKVAAYLASPRRIPFNEQGIFRRYPELDT